MAELPAAVVKAKGKRNPGTRHIYPEILKHFESKVLLWLPRFGLTRFVSSKLRFINIIAIRKPEKPEDVLLSYRPIALLGVL